MSVTSRQIAKVCGVSQATVSLVVNNKWEGRVSESIAKKVQDTANDLGYSPNRVAQDLRSGTTNVIYMVAPNLNNEFFNRVYSAASQCARRHGLEVLAMPLSGPDERTILPTTSHGADYLVPVSILPPYSLTEKFTTVYIDAIPNNDKDHWGVCIDFNPAVKDLVSSFKENRVNLVVHIAADRDSSTFKERGGALREKLEDEGIEIVEIRVPLQLSESKKVLERKLPKFIDRDKTSIVCDTDRLALSAMRVMDTLNCNREKIVLAIFDKSDINEIEDKEFLAIDMQPEVLGRTAVDLIVDSRKNLSPKKMTVKAKMVRVTQ